jgi:hypothetical protein
LCLTQWKGHNSITLNRNDEGSGIRSRGWDKKFKNQNRVLLLFTDTGKWQNIRPRQSAVHNTCIHEWTW